MQPSRHIAIIGAGPAALMAAETLATAGYAVTIYDRMPSPGRKFLIAGRGGLNLTHSEPLESFLTRYAEAADWLAPAIRAYPPETLRAWCEGLGEETFVGSSGRIFPKTMKAVTLLRAWLRRLEKLGVRYQPRHTWLGWDAGALRFATPTGDIRITPDATLLALGGASWPRLGSDGSWASILAAEGVPLSPLRPSNSGFVTHWSDYFRERFAGQPLKTIAITHGAVTKHGEAMFTAQGIEGGAIYALSAPIRETIIRQGRANITIDLRPSMTLDALTKKLEAPRASRSLSSFLRSAGFDPVALALLRESLTPEQLTSASAAALATRLKALPLALTATSPIARAISTAGGIRREALDQHYMLKSHPGTFAAGEMLDWEAPTGGYLLQACFSTAVAAAHGMIDFLKTQSR